MKMKQTTPIVQALTLGSLLVGPASGTTILLETFGTLPAPLDGTTTDTGQIWSTSPSFFEESGRGIINSDGEDKAGIISGITVVPNCVYHLSMDVQVDSNGSDWIGFGFKTTSFSNLLSGTVGSMLHRGSPEVQMFSSNSSNEQTFVALNQEQTMEIILQTGATLADSSVSWTLDGVPLGSSFAVNASNIDGIFIQSRQSSFGSIDNLELSHVPEPSSALLSLIAGGCLLLRRRRSS